MREVAKEPQSGPASRLNKQNDDVNHLFQSPALVRHQLLQQLTQDDSSNQSSPSKSTVRPTKEKSPRKAAEGRADIQSRNMTTILSVLPPDQIASKWSPGSRKNEEMRRTVSGKVEKVFSRFMSNGKTPTTSTLPGPTPTNHGKSQSQSSSQIILSHQRKISVPERSSTPMEQKYKTERRPISISETPAAEFRSFTWNHKQNGGYSRQSGEASSPVRSSEKDSVLAQRKSATLGKSRSSDMMRGLRKMDSVDGIAPISEHGWDQHGKHPMKKESVQSLRGVVTIDHVSAEKTLAGSSKTVPIRPSSVSLDDYDDEPVPVTVLGDDDDEPISPATYVTAVAAAAAEDERTSRVSSPPNQGIRQPSGFVEPPANEECDLYSDDDDSDLVKRDGALKIEELHTQDEGLKVRVAVLEEQLSQALTELARARNEFAKAVRDRDDAKAGWMTEANNRSQAEKWAANLKERLENAEELTDMLHESEREREASGGTIQRLREENAMLRKALDATEKEGSLALNAAKKEAAMAVRDAEGRVAVMIREAEGRAVAMNDLVQRKDSEIKHLQEQLDGVTAQRDRSQNQLEGVTAQRDRLQDQLDGVTTHRDRLQNELNDLRGRADEHIGKVQQLQNHLEELSLDAQHKEEQCREQQAQLEKTEHEFRLFEKRIHQFQDALQAKNSQIDQLSTQLRQYQLGFASTGESKRDSGLGSSYYPSINSAENYSVREFEYQGTPQTSRTQPVGSKTSPSNQRSWDSQPETRGINATQSGRTLNDKRNPFAPTTQQESNTARPNTAPPSTPQVSHTRPTSSTGKSNLKSHNVSSQIAAVLGGGSAGDVQSPLKSKQSASSLGEFGKTEERHREDEYEYATTKTPQRGHRSPQQISESSEEDHWRDIMSRGDYQSVSKQIDVLTNEIKRLESMRSRKLHIREREKIEEEYEAKNKQRAFLKMLIKRDYGGPMLI
ncbi:hypothetical protein BJ742DRAFT_159747 [Cladochytrium replicatum]|nr:hypothetical protein BJ742DRAFT_159747 [Cladochytrium replicatum]